MSGPASVPSSSPGGEGGGGGGVGEAKSGWYADQDCEARVIMGISFYVLLQLDIVSAGKNYNKIRKALCSGFFHHAAKKDPQARLNLHLVCAVSFLFVYLIRSALLLCNNAR